MFLKTFFSKVNAGKSTILEPKIELEYLEKSKEKDFIRLNDVITFDYWYKVEYEGQIGWVYGYYTNQQLKCKEERIKAPKYKFGSMKKLGKHYNIPLSYIQKNNPKSSALRAPTLGSYYLKIPIEEEE